MENEIKIVIRFFISQKHVEALGTVTNYTQILHILSGYLTSF